MLELYSKIPTIVPPSFAVLVLLQQDDPPPQKLCKRVLVLCFSPLQISAARFLQAKNKLAPFESTVERERRGKSEGLG
ncbi:hypothetical protein SLEP1_g49814 [Rubroshorea leprosula]|uniref:Uncharacterized protein n=1 Tax=Rubroshorea leprosula TaxID=152421 RepID=A0AAV5LYA4_9ROSI|nr:hypothetical protein SLEP1_g49814 [Rubroshorea leprosula]